MEQFDRYLRDEMTAEQKAAFEKQLQADPALKEDFQTHQELLAGIYTHGDAEMKAKLEGIHQKYMGNTKRKKRWLWAALSLLLLMLLLLTYWFTRPPADPAQYAYKKFFEPYPLQGMTRDVAPNERTADLMEYGRIMYKKGRYNKALSAFQKLSEIYPEDDKLRLLIAICLTDGGYFKWATPQFEKIIQRDNSVFVDQARWYYALMHVRDGNFEAATPLLEMLSSDPQADHHEEAIKLLQFLE